MGKYQRIQTVRKSQSVAPLTNQVPRHSRSFASSEATATDQSTAPPIQAQPQPPNTTTEGFLSKLSIWQQDTPTAQRVIQRDTYMEQRQVRSRYGNEETVQRPDLIQAITFKAGQVKGLYNDYVAARQSGIPSRIKLAEQKWRRALTFLRKQDVLITDEGDFDPKTLKNRLVEYDKDSVSQAKTNVTISGGTLTRSTGEVVDTKDSVTFQKGLGWEIFVMGPGGNLHMASHKIGKYHHSSLLGGGNVAAAGMMRVSGGTIQELNNHSGHYAPQEQHIRQAVRQLQKQGVSLAFTLEISGVFKGPASDYMKPTSAGGQGGEETVEFNTTNHVIKHFMSAKGLPAVKTAFTNAGWTYIVLGGNRFKLQKPDTSTPTHQEVRELLSRYFGEEAAPNVTRLD